MEHIPFPSIVNILLSRVIVFAVVIVVVVVVVVFIVVVVVVVVVVMVVDVVVVLVGVVMLLVAVVILGVVAFVGIVSKSLTENVPHGGRLIYWSNLVINGCICIRNCRLPHREYSMFVSNLSRFIKPTALFEFISKAERSQSTTLNSRTQLSLVYTMRSVRSR